MNQLGAIFSLENRLSPNPLRVWQLFGEWIYILGIHFLLIALRMPMR
jgi:hypothetical protein